MNNADNQDLTQHDEFYDLAFKGLNLEKQSLSHKIFENCQFHQGNFKDADLQGCKFVECDFHHCDLSFCQMGHSSFNDVIFNDSKLLGIDWTKVKWPLIKLSSPVKFYRCNISHSNFMSLELAEIIMEECKACDVDFRESDCSKASFMQTDLESSLFTHTNLTEADFTDAFNYAINPLQNTIKKAKFSLPDAINLLQSFEIEIE